MYYYTKSKTLAYALNFVGYTFYKFNDELDRVVYSFRTDDMFYEKLKKLEEIKFM